MVRQWDGYSALDSAICHDKDATIQVLHSFHRRFTVPVSLRIFPHLFVVRYNFSVAAITADELPTVPSRIIGPLDWDELHP
jgi:hypothetical protein